jgi:protein-L-isoaspartate(D-aspartate) O-methyltransferase
VDDQNGLVDELKRKGALRSARAEAVLREVDRKFFVPPGEPYIDRPVAIGYNATISAPHTHAQALEELEPYMQPGRRVLDIGCGSGYLTICFALLVGPSGSSRGIDHMPELVEQTMATAIAAGYEDMLLPGGNQLRFSAEDGRGVAGLGKQYDAIYCGAAADEAACDDLAYSALAPGGKLMITVDYGETEMQVLRTYVKDERGVVTSSDLEAFNSNIIEMNYPSYFVGRDRYPKLTDVEAQRRGELSATCSVM